MADQESRSSIAKAAVSKDRPAKPYEVRAARPAGLLLRVQPSGSRTFYVQLGRAQRVRVGPAGVYTLKQAVERAHAILKDPGAATGPRQGSTLVEYVDNHYSDHALAKLKNGEKSVARVKSIWKALLGKRMTAITAAEVDKLRTKRLLAGITPATVNRDIAALSGVFAHWCKNIKSATNPLTELEALDVADDERIRYLAPDESMRLRAALKARDDQARSGRTNANKWRATRAYALLPELGAYSDHITPMVVLSMNTGLRQGELFSLAWSSVDMQLKTITVLASHSKGNNTRHIPLNTEALAVLQAIRSEGADGLVFKSPVTGGEFDNVKRAWAEVTKAAKVPDVRWHDLRHNFASQLVMHGAPIFTVQKLLGHSNPRMTQRYARLAPEQLADAVALLGIA